MTDAGPSSDAVLLKIDRFGQRFQRCRRVPGTVRPVLVVVVLVIARSAADGSGSRSGRGLGTRAGIPDPAFGNRVHAGRPHIAQHGPDPGIGKDRVECGGEVRATVADHELHPLCLSAEVHDQFAGLLGGPFPGGVQRDAEDTDTPGRVPDHGKDAGLGAAGQASAEEVAGQDYLGLGAQKLRPGQLGATLDPAEAATWWTDFDRQRQSPLADTCTEPDSQVMALWSCRARVRRDWRSSI